MNLCSHCLDELIDGVPCDCTWDGQPDRGDIHADVPSLWPPGPVGPPRGTAPFAGAAAAVRGKRHRALANLAEWSLARGRPVDLDTSAALLEVFLTDDDGVRAVPLRRPDVYEAIRIDLHNWCMFADTTVPRDVASHAWTTLEWMVATDRLSSRSDPLDALREPLRCYWGLDADGIEQPSGTPSGISCQCWLPHDPTTPAGMIKRIVARLWGDEFVAVVHPPDPMVANSLADHGPLLRLAKELRRAGFPMESDAIDWSFAGRTEASGKTPAIWFYRYEPAAKLGYDLLAVDEQGQVYQAVADARRKVGYRWEQMARTSVNWRFREMTDTARPRGDLSPVIPPD